MTDEVQKNQQNILDINSILYTTDYFVRLSVRMYQSSSDVTWRSTCLMSMDILLSISLSLSLSLSL